MHNQMTVKQYAEHKKKLFAEDYLHGGERIDVFVTSDRIGDIIYIKADNQVVMTVDLEQGDCNNGRIL